MVTVRSCKRCSVTRVNVLCELYDRAFHQDDRKARKNLGYLTSLAAQRGYDRASAVLSSDLNEEQIRSHCWNVSSLLEDEDLERLGLDVPK